MDRYHFWPTLAVAAAGLFVGLCLPGGWARRIDPVARRPWLAALVVAAVNLACGVLPTWHLGWPEPYVNDEYGYLLIADTFAHGRLSNPTPTDADAFASPHVLLRPTYTAKYPPGQAVVLLLGRLLGRPIYGVWLTGMAAAVATYWAARPLAPPAWSLLGGLVAAAHPMLADWAYVYWGGDAAALGGALAVGGWARLLTPSRRLRYAEDPGPRVAPAALLGLGLAVLAFTRPYEGFVFSLPLLASLAQRRRTWTPAVLVPLAAVLVLAAAATLAYDAAVTGHPLRPPMIEYARQWDVAPKFWPLPERSATPPFPNPTLAWMHAGNESAEWHLWRSLPGAVVQTGRRLVRGTLTFARPGLLLVPLALALGVPDRRVRWLWATLAVTTVGLWAETFYLEHYAAPAMGTVIVLLTVGWHRLHGRSPRLARGLVVGFAAGSVYAATLVGARTVPNGQAAVVRLLGPRVAAGRHLLFVRYTHDHVPNDELVYDGADPAGQRLLWARARSAAADRAVVRDYPGRRCWLLTVGRTDLTAVPYAP